ncbi:Methyltransferase domain-containing protein [Desulfocicer vacuolatum DSM 3385]|uniref:Methyltransferase domain-containing protein n=1 Tax=Desulfocicer vacuolatum DSM 3385 TaxID=1121400 RepID=A0A1W2DQ35_9BACT|nr:class I SAM-dependent methyltransferase [Desulfocicer vacuolatum]SMC99531.1 Methyltransferase domain-containing protein [Desulfocicer vacuolatum DSM 3385]
MEYNRIDWNDAWKNEIDLWHEASGKSCKEYWDDKKSAAVYSKRHMEHHQARVEKTLKELPLTPESRVLDIGAGPGNLAIPMAEIVKSVTTVEPSFGMNDIMQERIKDENIINIKSVKKTWEEVDPQKDLCPPYDIVMASMSLGMRDIRAAIEKMNQVCKGSVVLFWHAGTPGWEDMPNQLWPKLFGKQYHGGPKSDILFQVLYQMGIYPEVKVFPNHFHEVFSSMETAMSFYIKRFEKIEPRHRPFLESYLKEKCLKTDQGLVHGFDHIAMKISWQHGGRDNDA